MPGLLDCEENRYLSIMSMLTKDFGAKKPKAIFSRVVSVVILGRLGLLSPRLRGLEPSIIEGLAGEADQKNIFSFNVIACL